jgi:uncharacterized protein
MAHNYHAIMIATAILMPLFGLAVTGCSAHAPRPADAFTDSGARALAEAAQRGDVKEIDRLVTSGVDVNATGKFGVTPLFCALSSRNHEGFLGLLELGANPDKQVPELDFGRGSSVTSIAARSESDSYFLEAVLKHGANANLVEPRNRRTPIFQAVGSRNFDNLDLLIRAGADLNHKDGDFGETPAMFAASLNQFEAVYRLLDAGADYRATNNHGIDLAFSMVCENMPFTGEFRRWKDKVLDFLEKKGVDLDAARKKAEAKGIRTKKWSVEQ